MKSVSERDCQQPNVTKFTLCEVIQVLRDNFLSPLEALCTKKLIRRWTKVGKVRPCTWWIIEVKREHQVK